MRQGHATEYLAECFWPGVQQSDLSSLDERATASAAAVSGDGVAVRYLGSLVMREDEVVLCRFEGPESAVRRVAERAGIPFERILEAGHSPGASEPVA
jgi:predicted esterase